MAYKSPGISVTSEFQNIVNPSVGGDLTLGILAGVDVTNVNLNPTATVEFRREGLEADANVDIGWFTRGDEWLAQVTDANRIISMTQSSTTYNTAIIGTDATGVEVITMTKDATADSTGAASSITPDADGVKAVYYYNIETGSFTYYTPDTDFTYSVAGTTVTISWVDGGSAPATDATFYVLAEEVSAVNSDTDAILSIIKSPSNSTATTGETYVGIMVYWLAGATNTPDDSSVYYASVRKEFTSALNTYTSSSEVQKAFGPLADPTDLSVTNPVAVAGHLAFAEGSTSIMIAPYNLNSELASATTALEALAATDEVNIVASTSTDEATGTGTVNGLLVSHVESASGQVSKKYRIGIINPYHENLDTDLSTTTFAEALADYDTITAAIDSERMLVVGPPKAKINLPVPPDGASRTYTFGATTANGNYLGVIAGAMMTRAGADVATSLLRKRTKSVASLLPKWDDVKLDKIASKAVTLFAKVNGQWVVRDDITTSRSNLLMKSEPTITMIADNIATASELVLERGLIGGKLKTPGVLNVIRDRLGGMLTKKVQDGIISKYGTPQLEVDSTDPRMINVTIPIQPMFTLKYIDITFSYVAKL